MEQKITQPEFQTQQPLELDRYARLLLGHKWLIALCMVVGASLALLHNNKMVPVYRATSTIIIESEMPKLPVSQGVYYYQSYMSEVYGFKTHFKLIVSNAVLKEVVERLGLDTFERKRDRGKLENPNTLSKYFQQLKSNLRLLLGQKAKAGAEALPESGGGEDPESEASGQQSRKVESIVNSLRGMIQVEPVEETRLVNVHVTNTDPVLAMDIANTLSEAYIDFNAENRLRATRDTMGWLTDQLYEMKKKLEEAEAEFLAYNESVKLISVEDSQKTIAEKIASFNDSYLSARNKRMEVEAKLEQLRRLSSSGKDAPHLRSLIGNSLIDSLYSQLLEAEIELSRLSEKYRHKHPKYVQTTVRISEIRRNLDQEIRKEVGNLKAERSVLLAKENVLQKTIEDFEKEAMETNTKELQSTILERNLETNQRLYDAILVRIKESNLEGNLEASNIRVAEKASTPRGAINQRSKSRNLILGCLMGFMLGAGLSFLLDYMDRSVRSEDDVNRYMGIPVLAVVPIGEQAKDGTYGDAKRRSPGKAPGGENGGGRKNGGKNPAKKAAAGKKDTKHLNLHCLDNYPIHSRFAESYRSLRTNIHFSFVNGAFNTLLVTSSAEQEGKTTTATNLGITIARAGRSVLIIDADLRKPSLAKMFGIGPSPGLTGLLSGTFGTDVVSGSLKEFGLGDLLWLLSFQKKTGRLALSDGREAVDIYFMDGEPVDVHWRTGPKEQKLAYVLVRNKLIDKDQAMQAMSWAGSSCQRLAAVLIGMGAVDADTLARYLALQALGGLRAASNFRSGKFYFEKLPASRHGKPPIGGENVRRLCKNMDMGEKDLPYVEKSIDKCIVHSGLEKLYLLPSGKRPPNPGEIIHSARMSFLLSYLNRRFDVIIIDSPPILPSSDALLLAAQVDGTIMVVKAGGANREIHKKVVDQTRSAQANVVGAVLNQVDTRGQGYYRYYYKYYSKYYGEGL